MTEPFLAEIRMFGGNFAIRGWAFCNGQTIPLQQNPALFSLLGTTFGGDGRSTFGLPNFQGSAPMHWGQSPNPGVSSRALGETGGTTSVTLTTNTMATHNHSLSAFPRPASVSSPTDATLLALTMAPNTLYAPSSGASLVPMSPQGTSTVGGNAPHNNMQPYQVVNFLIALQGVFPQRP